MRPALARLAVRLYPKAWRERYGTEFQQLLEDEAETVWTALDLVRSALFEHVTRTRGHTMNSTMSPTFSAFLRRPSVFLPLLLSSAALLLVLGHAVLFGGAHEIDEGAAAHVWQLLMAAQLPLLAFLAIHWLPRAKRQALVALGLLAGTTLCNLAAVFFLT